MQLDDFVEAINSRAEGYYTNPYRNLSNAEAGELFWRDSRAQRVPYGRGFVYLASLDAQIHEATDGARSVDDLVLEVLEHQRAGETVDNEAWVELVVAELGEKARED